MKKRLVIIDMDETLMHSNRIVWIFMHISRYFRHVGLWFQRKNNKILNEITNDDTVIILTGRIKEDKNMTEKQVKRVGIEPDKIIMIDWKILALDWKKGVVETLKEIYGIYNVLWFDDHLEGEVYIQDK